MVDVNGHYNVIEAIEAGKKIEKEIYKPVWQFDGKWTCVENNN